MKYLIPLLLMVAWIPTADAQMAKPSDGLEGRVGRLEGVVEQIDKRLTNIEQDQREMLKRMEAMRRDMESMNSDLRGEMRGEMNSLRRDINSMRSELQSEINTSFRWLVGIIVTLFLGNVGVNWYWHRKNASAEVPSPVPRSAESRPAARPVADRPLVAEEETPAS